MYNSCTGIHKFGNNTYPRRIGRRSNLGHVFREKSASYGPGNTLMYESMSIRARVCVYVCVYARTYACI
jgi:hypothetical protein